MENSVPADYAERVYAGVLGKIIGVYLGRPFEGWSNREIEDKFGDITYYVNEKLGHPLIVSDDDISGTFTFLRALEDHYPAGYDLIAEQIGNTWLNYLIENRTILWWGGMGVSTEHTAYLRLKAGIPAPKSGSIVLNTTCVAEQIGAQIFIDGWAMVCPGDPEKAAALAERAARVSHDGEAVYAAQVIAAMEALAFVEPSLPRLLDTAAGLIPSGCVISRLIADLREWHSLALPGDWRATLRRIQERYGYDKYGGGCHVVPNHAVVLLALLHGGGDFTRSLMIANTAGWDTDCNSANVGCLLAIRNGLEGIDAGPDGPDWRSPVADRLFLPTADGGRCVSDALTEAYRIVNMGRSLRGLPPVYPKADPVAAAGMSAPASPQAASSPQAPRYHFSLPGSLQGFQAEQSAESGASVSLGNVPCGETGSRCLKITITGFAPDRPARVFRQTFLTTTEFGQPGYHMQASPALYPGQAIRARLLAPADNPGTVRVCLYVAFDRADGSLERHHSPAQDLAPGEAAVVTWTAPDGGGRPIVLVGLDVSPAQGGASDRGRLQVDWLTWGGPPRTTFGRPSPDSGDSWKRAWVNATDHYDDWGLWGGNVYRLSQDRGTGLILQGEQSWSDYVVSTVLYPHLADEVGLAANVRGVRRYVALTLRPDGMARLLLRHDDAETVLIEAPLPWRVDHRYSVSLTSCQDGRLEAAASDGDQTVRLEATVGPDQSRGAIGLLLRVGHAQYGAVTIFPIEAEPAASSHAP